AGMRGFSKLTKLVNSVRTVNRTNQPHAGRSPRSRARLRLEPLEARALLSLASSPVGFDSVLGLLRIAADPAGTAAAIPRTSAGAERASFAPPTQPPRRSAGSACPAAARPMP